MLQVEGIPGMYLANKLVDNRVKTFITYDKGQTWALLPAPTADVAGNNLHCIPVSHRERRQALVHLHHENRVRKCAMEIRAIATFDLFSWRKKTLDSSTTRIANKYNRSIKIMHRSDWSARGWQTPISKTRFSPFLLSFFLIL